MLACSAGAQSHSATQAPEEFKVYVQGVFSPSFLLSLMRMGSYFVIKSRLQVNDLCSCLD